MGTTTADKFSKALDARSYDAYAEAYGKYIATLSAPLTHKICQMAELRSGQEVLDVASRTGVCSRIAAKIVGTAGRVIGIDASEGMVHNSSSLFYNSPNLSFLQMDAEKLEFPDNSFDAVISLCGILHFPDVESAISEMFRVLRPGGHLAVAYGAGHPQYGVGLLRHKIKRVLQVSKQPCLFAPAILCKLAAKELGHGHDDGVLTAWSKHHPERHIIKTMRRAGFHGMSHAWHGHDVEFSSPDMYWEAQLSIVTDVRKRLEQSTVPDVQEHLKSQFLTEARKVVSAGGKLLYPYGAVFIKATKPSK